MYKENQAMFYDMIYVFISFFLQALLYVNNLQKFTKYAN